MEDDKYVLPNALVNVLRISRVLGIAPLNFQYTNGRYMATVSRDISMFTCLYLAMLFAQGKMEGSILPLGTAFIILTTITITGIGSYFGVRRMNMIFDYISTLQKITCKINGIFTYQNNRVFVVMLVYLILLGLYILSVKVFLFNIKTAFADIFVILHHTEFYKTVLLRIEYALVELEIHHVLQMINKRLHQLADELKSDSITAYMIRTNCETVRELMKSYLSICEMVESMNKNGGYLMFLLFLDSILILMFTICSIIDVAYSLPESYQTVGLFIQLTWCIWHLSTAILFVEPCHRITEEVIEIRIALTHLMYEMTPIGKPIALELDLMFKQLILNEPQIIPLRMYTVQRSLLTKAIGYITTYLVIVIQHVKGQRWKN